MRALIIVDGWKKEMDIDYSYWERGWVNVIMPVKAPVRPYKNGTAICQIEASVFTCVLSNKTENGRPIFECKF